MNALIEPTHDLSPVEIDAIEDSIYGHNRRATGRNDAQGLGFVIRDEARRTIGVAAGYSWASTSELMQMWVDEAHRGRGYARELLAAFEAEAANRGVRRIWVMSYDFQAPEMYEKAGFSRVAEFAGWPEGYSNIVLCKVLGQRLRDSPWHIERYDADRSALLPLFALADDSQAQISKYMSLGEVLVARHDNAIVAHLQILETEDPAVFEVKSMAVTLTRQGEGIGRSLVDAAAAWCRHRGGHQLIVSTATADIGNLRFYQRLGFRMYRVVQDAFGPSAGYPADALIAGIPVRDQVSFALQL